jgi:hypothetical protein
VVIDDDQQITADYPFIAAMTPGGIASRASSLSGAHDITGFEAGDLARASVLIDR